jgi:hypothetical protein
MSDTKHKRDKYIVLITNWAGYNGHWIKSFPSLESARDALMLMYDGHYEIANHAFIIKGEIEQIGVD